MFAGHFDFPQPLVWTIDDVLDAAACDELRANRAEGRAVDRTVRNNLLVLVDDAAARDPARAAAPRRSRSS